MGTTLFADSVLVENDVNEMVAARGITRGIDAYRSALATQISLMVAAPFLTLLAGMYRSRDALAAVLILAAVAGVVVHVMLAAAALRVAGRSAPTGRLMGCISALGYTAGLGLAGWVVLSTFKGFPPPDATVIWGVHLLGIAAPIFFVAAVHDGLARTRGIVPASAYSVVALLFAGVLSSASYWVMTHRGSTGEVAFVAVVALVVHVAASIIVLSHLGRARDVFARASSTV